MAYSTVVTRHKTREVVIGDHAVGGEALYNDISKGMNREEPSFDDEEQMRCFWREWDRRMSAMEA